MTTRDPMAPDTEPTDEELAAVMDAARELAVQRRVLSDAWVTARLEEAARFAREHRSPHEDERPSEDQRDDQREVS